MIPHRKTGGLSFAEIQHQWDDYGHFLQEKDIDRAQGFPIWCRLVLINSDTVARYHLMEAGWDAKIVDDSVDVLYYLERILAPKYQLIKAHNGREGWETVVQLIPDIVISDVVMPEMDGYQLTDLSTSQFLHYFRLKKAKALLADAHFNISEVAYSCGFSDPGYFGKLFAKKYGQSPQAYRNGFVEE